MNEQTDLQNARHVLATKGIAIVPAWKQRALFEDTNFNGLADHYEKKIQLEEEVLRSYQQAINPRMPVRERLRAFLAASSRSGRIGKAVKDFALLFIPFGKTVESVTEFVTERFIKPKQTKSIMLKENFFEKALRYLKQPSTRTGLTVLITLVTGWFSFDLKPEVFLSSVIGIITGLSGIYAGIRGVQELFKDEDERDVQP